MSALYRKHRWLAEFQEANGRRFRLFAILSALGIAALALGCERREVSGNQDAPAVPVKTIALQLVPIPDTSEYLGTLKSRHSTALNPQVEGQVTQILVKSGDHVTAGTPLMQIDPLKQQAAVGSEEAARAAQLANVQFAQTQWERVKKLYDAGVVSKQDFDQAQTNLDMAKQQLKSLDAQVRQQEAELRYYRVVAPTDGLVGDIPVRVGDRVTTSTLLTTVDEPGSLELYVNVPVERSKNLKLGQTVQLLDDAGNLVGESQVNFISAEVDNNLQSILVKASVKNNSGALRTSQFARARIIWGVHRGLVIPVLAVSRINGQFFVFVVESSGKSLVAHQKMLHLGEMIGDQYVVLDGIKAGDRVVVQGVQNLTGGSRVSETSQGSSGKPSF